MKKLYIRIVLLSMIFASAFLTGCVSNRRNVPVETKMISRNLTDAGIKTATQLYYFFLANNPSADKTTVRKLALLYRKEASMEGINSDCAFIQMCLETGFLTYGNLVTPEMHNYCGLGATDAAHRGVSFDTEQEGVRAHIQHLHAYATTANRRLKNERIDPRYAYVTPRGKAPTIYGLSGTWAADREYGQKLDNLLTRLEQY